MEKPISNLISFISYSNINKFITSTGSHSHGKILSGFPPQNEVQKHNTIYQQYRKMPISVNHTIIDY